MSKLARSYKMDRIDDNFSIHLNIKWLIQLLMLTGTLVYAYVGITTQLSNITRELELLSERVIKLEAKHEAEIKEIEKWYKQSLELNPLKWGRKNK
jgi:predicted sulfurtransferase|tara:strand:- start:5642 stop:5929 length:288 start_codon:yes stop_codon:yes gene_type:complete